MFHLTEFFLCLTGINRYIVGCKSMSEEIKTAITTGINRYIVGCKLSRAVCAIGMRFELIDT